MAALQALLKKSWFVPVLLLGLVLLVYGSHLQNEYMIDDHEYLLGTHDSTYQSWTDYFTKPHGHHYYPIYYLIEIQFFRLLGGQLALQRLIIFSVFYVNCLLLFMLYKRLAKNTAIAAGATLLFAIHPYNTDMMNPVSNVFLLVYGAIMLLTFNLICRAMEDESSRKMNMIVASCTYLLGLMTYDNGLLFPGVVFLYLFFVCKKGFLGSIKYSLPFWIVSFSYFAFWIIYVESSSSTMDFIQQLGLTPVSWVATLTYLLGWYLKNFFVPTGIVFLNETSPLTQNIGLMWMFLISGLGLIAYLCAIRWKLSLKSFLLLWFCLDFIILIPGSVAHPDFGVVIEHHWFYISSMAFYLFAFVLVDQLTNPTAKRLGRIALILLFTICLLQTKNMLMTARTEAGYARHWLRVAPNNMMASRTMGDYYLYKTPQKDFEKARMHYQRILDKTGFDPSPVHDWIGNAYWYEGDLANAEKYYQKSIALKPTATTYCNLGELYWKQKNMAEAHRHYSLALKINPNEGRAKRFLQQYPDPAP